MAVRPPTDAPQGEPCGKKLSSNAPRNEQGHPYREAGDDCCPHYRFREEIKSNYHRCGWCKDFRGSGDKYVCINENNRGKMG